ncbi:SDR family oxidoreductase, partial [Bacillus paranthracis]|uniref:SDR family oxidoreductase n=1 Tax=Bacillus paranthracis TaxID=2026186 RepID=UPI00284FAB15
QVLNHYSSSKGAVRAIAKAAAAAFGYHGFRFNSLFSGIIESLVVLSLSTSKELLYLLLQVTPFLRLGQPMDI